MVIVWHLLMICGLGAEDPAARSCSYDALLAGGMRALPLLRSCREHRDPEIRHRVRGLIGEITSEALKQFEPIPAIDGAWWDGKSYDTGQSPIVRARYERMGPYLDRSGYSSYPFPTYYIATRNWLVDEIEAGADLAALRRLVDEMRENDRAYYRSAGLACPFGP